MVGLPPGRIMTFSGETSTPVVVSVRRTTASRVAKQAVGRRVAVMAVAQRLDRRLDDVLRRLEVGLADAEIDDVLALVRESGRPREHGEGIFLAETVEGRNRVEHFLRLHVVLSLSVRFCERRGHKSQTRLEPCRCQ